MNYKLKDEYQGVIVSRNNPVIGRVTFNSNTVDPEHYENYFKLGFEELFEEIIEMIIDKTLDKIVDEVKEYIGNRKTKKKL